MIIDNMKGDLKCIKKKKKENHDTVLRQEVEIQTDISFVSLTLHMCTVSQKNDRHGRHF